MFSIYLNSNAKNGRQTAQIQGGLKTDAQITERLKNFGLSKEDFEEVTSMTCQTYWRSKMQNKPEDVLVVDLFYYFQGRK